MDGCCFAANNWQSNNKLSYDPWVSTDGHYDSDANKSLERLKGNENSTMFMPIIVLEINVLKIRFKTAPMTHLISNASA